MSKRKRDEEEEEEEECVEEGSSEETASDDSGDGLKRTVVVGNLEGKMEVIYQSVLSARFPGAAEITVDWKTRTAVIEMGNEDKAAVAAQEFNGSTIFGENVTCGVSSGVTAELLFTNLAPKSTANDIKKLIGDDSGVLSCKIAESRDKSFNRCFVRFADKSNATLIQQKLDGHTLHGSRMTVTEPPPMTFGEGGKKGKGKGDKGEKGGDKGKGGKGSKGDKGGKGKGKGFSDFDSGKGKKDGKKGKARGKGKGYGAGNGGITIN